MEDFYHKCLVALLLAVATPFIVVFVIVIMICAEVMTLLRKIH